jgi:hypothetical protein
MNKNRPDAPPNIYKDGRVKSRKELGLDVGAATDGDASTLSGLLSFTWSSEPPVEPGYYWFNHPEFNGPKIVGVVKRGNLYLISEEGLGYTAVDTIANATWAGPIPMPSEG